MGRGSSPKRHGRAFTSPRSRRSPAALRPGVRRGATESSQRWPGSGGAAAHRSAHRPLLFPPALSPAAGLWAGLLLFVPPAAVVAEFCLGRGSQQPFRRAASTGQADLAGSVLDCPRQLHHAGKADRRGIRPFAERRVFVGEPEFSGRTARGGSSRRKAGAGHRRRKAGRRIGQKPPEPWSAPISPAARCWSPPDRPWRPGSPSSAQPAQSGTAPPSSNPPPGPSSPDSIGGARADRAADRFHKASDRAAIQPPCRFVQWMELSPAGLEAIFQKKRRWPFPAPYSRSGWGCAFPFPSQKPLITSRPSRKFPTPKNRRWPWQSSTACKRFSPLPRRRNLWPRKKISPPKTIPLRYRVVYTIIADICAD